MSDKKQETIADIVAEVRARAKAWPDPSLVQYDERLADRIDAAHKREREAGAEAAQICGEIGEMVGREAACHRPVTDCHGLNAAAMREACANIAEYAKTAACHTEDAHLIGYLNQIERWAEDALSSPPRNCDVLSDKQEALAAIHEDRGYVNNPIDERRLTVEWLFDEAKEEKHMSRSNYDNPFYVDVGTSVVSIRCASNSDVIFEYDYTKCPQVIQFAKDNCDRMNREVEICRPLRNCDVGTAEEQSDRFDKFCYSYNSCSKCPVKSLWNSSNRQKQLREIIRCEIIWSQMPYEEVK